ncbi:Tyrocidine synthase 3 [Kordia antarctica]|uniref:Tyrocidine synthase 3 n=1 Tax=Kordia antarctica TaxID=1218801 RepID=A0A7L4ZFG2_9FLAO|nr:non-ribosomal peptide synthetase [Kordia antarctica]QHI35403.1 Tyrocidine synthase 3 [Kordia antarctica]
MNLQEDIKTARTEEYWRMHLGDVSNAEGSSFFETHIKDRNAITKEKVFLNKEAVTKVAALCNDSDVLIYNFYLNIVAILCRNYQEDITFVSPTDQFDHVEAKDELFFVQPKLLPETTFKEAFSGQKENLVECIDYALPWTIIQQYLGDEGLLEKIQPYSFIIGESAHAGIFETDFIKTIFKCVLEETQPYFEITIKGNVYDTKLLTLFGENFNATLLEVLEKTYEPIETLKYKGASEIEILQNINTVTPYFSLERNIVEIITEHCETFSDKVAIKHNNEEVTFSALGTYTNKFASYLLDTFQAKTDDLFGIMMQRSPRMIESILSIWKAGSAYVPIGVNLPDENLAQIIENSQLKAIITDDEAMLTQLSRLNISIPIINLNDMQEALKSFSEETVSVRIQPNDLAYVIYTSGSTGAPKGVMIEHIGMLNHMGAKIHEIGIDENSIISQNAPHTFDISVWQMFTSLLTGGTCIIYDNDDIIDVEKFATNVAKDRITVLELVPSYLLIMLHFLESERKKTELQLNNIILNAETLIKPLVKRWLTLYPKIPIINTYGATEVSDDTSHYFMESVPENYSVPVMTIPIQNFEVHIVNENLQQVPIGVKGEILLAGPCVGRGYFKDVEKTKKAFLHGPIDGLTSQKRIYKTGDSGRFNADGTMEFMGRNDNQVKILGHRIELDSIENFAAEIKGMKNVKAVAFIEKQLIVLYYMADAEIDKTLIENALAKKLPKYMLPSRYIHMQRFPLTKNGKIDKKALLKLGNGNEGSEVAFVAPETELEKEVAEIWMKVLDITSVSVNDVFFDLGGHSLKVMRLKNEYQKAFNIKIELKQLFENPILASHCTIIEASSHTDFVTIEPVPIQENYKLSNAQHRLWILSQFEEGSAAYNIPYTIPIQIEDLNLFKKAIHAVIDRHEVLRTVFKVNEDGEIRQWILDQKTLNFQIQYIEVTDSAAVQHYIEVDSFEPFNLENGPLIRASILKTVDDQYTFYFNMHHIISDGWSMEVLAKDVMEYYNYYMGKTPQEPTPLRIQYKEYTAWHLAQMGKNHESRDYWLKNLSGELSVIDLPTKKLRPKVRTYKGGLLTTYLDKETTDVLKNYSRANGGSLFISLLSTFTVLLNRYTSKDDIIIGSPISGRDHIDLKDQIGFYVNTLAFRNQVDSNENFASLYHRVKENTLEAYNHQMYPFDRLVEELNLKKDTSRSDIFDVMLTLQNNADNTSNLEIDKIELDTIKEYKNVASKFDLQSIFEEVGDCISFSMIYNMDVYDATMLKKLMKHYKQLITSLITNPDVAIGKVNYLTVDEKKKLLENFNATEVVYPQDKTIINLFEEQAAKNPTSIAVVFEDTRLSYRELDELSNQLAHYLIDNYSIEKEDLIGIKLERSEWIIISILGVLKAGGAYVPIDSGYPEQRISFIEEDTNWKVCIDLNELNNFKLAEKYPSTKPEITVLPSNLAYVIYTSGTTGKPKGVMVENKSVINLINYQTREFKIDSKDNILLFSNYVFDASVEQIFLGLLNSATVVVISKELIISDDLSSFLNNHEITHLHATPTYLEQLRGIEKCNTLKRVISGGEICSLKLAESISPNIEFYNKYGPTETTVTSIEFKRKKKLNKVLPIGKPIGNTQVYILNDLLELQPIGIVGEVFLGGAGLSRGYLNNTELTAEKFIVHPFKEGERLYKTGDLARWFSDGNIEFIGRKDNQVKIRGYRIEIGEIESALSEIHAIESSAVIAIDSHLGTKELVAYVTSKETLSIEYLREELQKSLPDYMLPSYFVQIERFPRTVNGKMDKSKLLDIDGNQLESSLAHIAPRNETEGKLAAIWEEVLDEEKVGMKDNFFTLGGNSIKAIKLLTFINKTFEVDINITDVFTDRTIENIAIKIAFIKGQEKLKDSKEMYKEIKL